MCFRSSDYRQSQAGVVNIGVLVASQKTPSTTQIRRYSPPGTGGREEMLETGQAISVGSAANCDLLRSACESRVESA